MTNSILLYIFDDLEAMEVSYVDRNGATVTANCLNIDERADSIQTAHLPARILTQTQSDNGTIMRGAGIRVTWSITDLFLLETVGRDMGVFAVMPTLQRYKVAYLEALEKLWNLVHGWSTETLALAFNIQVGKYEYPSGSGTYYYGVKADITFEELI